MHTTIATLAVSSRACKRLSRPTRRALAKARNRAWHVAERGMATAEYAVGILAAVALALVLIKVFNSGGFLETITKLVTSIFSKLLGWLPD